MTIRQAYDLGYKDGENDGYCYESIRRGLKQRSYNPPNEKQSDRFTLKSIFNLKLLNKEKTKQ